VDVDSGDLVGGQIKVVDRTGSVENEYNQAGEVVTQLSNDGTPETQTFSYDARGNQTGSVLTGGLVETKQYDPDGRLVGRIKGSTIKVSPFRRP
jgi:YD repeat-containing protein